MTKKTDDSDFERLQAWANSRRGRQPTLDDPETLESEARFLAELEYLESRIPLEPLESDEARKASPVTEESDLFKLEWYTEKLAERLKAGDYEAARDFAKALIIPLRNQITRDANPPPGRNLASDKEGNPITVELVAERINTYLAQGVVEVSIVGVLAEELGVSRQTIYRRRKEAIKRALIAKSTTNAKE